MSGGVLAIWVRTYGKSTDTPCAKRVKKIVLPGPVNAVAIMRFERE